MHTTANSHITIDDKGIARIDRSRMKVIHVVKTMIAQKLNAEQLREQFPDLSLAQIYAALAYYYDHQSQIDDEIRRDTEEYLAEKAAAIPTPGREKLRKLGLRP
jgi:uncharacterized protein (DUF433 family)